MPSNHQLPARPKNYQELSDAGEDYLRWMASQMVKRGLDEQEAFSVCESISNFAKFFAHNYHELMLEGQVPEKNQLYREGTNHGKN